MKKITYGELCQIMNEHNEKTNEDYKQAITGVIVFKEENWTKPYNLEQRSYRVSSSNRAFQSGKISNSVFGDCLDGKDIGVRLDWYMWTVDYCYMD